VIAALVPSAAAGCFQFGISGAAVMAGAAGACLAADALARRFGGPGASAGPGRAALVGLLLGMSLPASAPPWLILAGCAVATLWLALARRAPGLGLLHPAAVALVLVQALFSEATHWSGPAGLFGSPLAAGAAGGPAAPGADLLAALVGRVPGGSGSTAALALALGGLYLLARGLVGWRTPVALLCAAAAPAALAAAGAAGALRGACGQVLSGPVLLGAFFVAADPCCAPVSRRGALIHGAACGLLTWLVGTQGGRPDAGVWIAILLAGLCVPLIDVYTAEDRGVGEPTPEPPAEA
jgi:electron transport complex protein RnfD